MGATSVGVRPTVEDSVTPNVETLLMDFDGNIYGKELKVSFIQRLRDEKKFDSIEELKKQIQLDAEQSRRILEDEPTP